MEQLLQLDYIFPDTDYTRTIFIIVEDLYSECAIPARVYAGVVSPKISLPSQLVVQGYIMPKLLGRGFPKHTLTVAELFPP